MQSSPVDDGVLVKGGRCSQGGPACAARVRGVI
jgi:hypothetical protein